MDRLTIGAFARASRLTAKALRRYDELGLLPPAHVDPYTGYRYYERSQLERARLVAWLRRIGMPIAGIHEICDLHEPDPAAAARAVRAHWARVEAETAARRDLAHFLADQLSPPSGKETDAMTSLGIRYAARTDRGIVRTANNDLAHADSRLLAVADGFGDLGASAGAAAIEALKEPAGSAPPRAGDLLNALEDAVARANSAIGALDGSGTTLTALVRTGSRLALVHIGDTRVQLLRDGLLSRITHDHTVVQSMIDAGSLTVEEAASHPQRTLLLKALDGGEHTSRPDLRLYEARPGDRYLLCSDGLFTAVAEERIHHTLATVADPDETVNALIALAHDAGGPDNIACVVADVVRVPETGGAAGETEAGARARAAKALDAAPGGR
ncbi:MerR family transcriptional regulator [Streptomyces sp. NPDC020141]|uniref:MerR family transcriptional regulator n=1 Tax=Streptomyces sp. NPDC020141 TaxID=3365065 RepID=UPI0037A637E4